MGAKYPQPGLGCQGPPIVTIIWLLGVAQLAPVMLCELPVTALSCRLVCPPSCVLPVLGHLTVSAGLLEPDSPTEGLALPLAP